MSSLSSGATLKVTVTVKVEAQAGTTLVNTATVSSTAQDPNTSNNSATLRTRVIADDGSQVGISELSPADSLVDVHERLNLALSWEHQVHWRRLQTIDLRISDAEGVAMWVRFDEPSNTFANSTLEVVVLDLASPQGKLCGLNRISRRCICRTPEFKGAFQPSRV